ncbi:MAG TPA: endonuclease/exonuclease/phosphatase family protein [Burkholderiaceae bacterium]|nr:endonuclease/exonuclease/phosphatase family protein [Burkholderiaceae bacterium]
MKLITWNIQWCRGVDGRVDPRRIVEHARALADFDVLCLQEVASGFPGLDGSAGENQFELLAGLLPGYTAISGVAIDVPGPGGERRAFGNMILSRLPVGQVLRLQLPWPADPGSKGMARMLIDAAIDTPLGPVRVMTTHLEYYSARQRAAQVEAIRARHAEAGAHARAGGPRDASDGPFRSFGQPASAILTADFNYRPEDPLHLRMQALFDDGTPQFVDAWQQAHPGAPHAHTLGVHDREQWPESYASDFIYVSEDLVPKLRAVKVDGDTQASDHQPVLIELG